MWSPVTTISRLRHWCRPCRCRRRCRFSALTGGEQLQRGHVGEAGERRPVRHSQPAALLIRSRSQPRGGSGTDSEPPSLAMAKRASSIASSSDIETPCSVRRSKRFDLVNPREPGAELGHGVAHRVRRALHAASIGQEPRPSWSRSAAPGLLHRSALTTGAVEPFHGMAVEAPQAAQRRLLGLGDQHEALIAAVDTHARHRRLEEAPQPREVRPPSASSHRGVAPAQRIGFL